jgi:hypothetical protein
MTSILVAVCLLRHYINPLLFFLLIHLKMSYLGRRWLEIFLGEITFRNALEHDADAAVREFSSIISSSTKQSALLPSLEDLLFHRLSWKERDSRCDFSSMFEQVQLSQNLGESDPPLIIKK